eukprot:TRINITY_DN1150_c0_g1_i1.p1 TRINITY_DN1150_c0_g1~~TRINITY_DN1150_c0_g1_i1.p1  ORF type:complete len:358 (-),score=31.28 TRINITY_DN1150_c0_g1_i1:29-1102(-)
MCQASKALWSLFVGDALASPAHWYYSTAQLKRDHGVIDGFVAPRERMEGSIMCISCTSGGGRGRDDGDIVGSVINHGKKRYWCRGQNYHYHCTLRKGENTLEAMLARVNIRHLTEHQLEFDSESYLTAFESFMTTPGTHNDAYASTYLRMFFKNRQKGVALNQCADNDDHNVDAMDAMTCLVPIVVACHLRKASAAERADAIERALRTTRKSDVLPKYGKIFGDMLATLLSKPHVNPAEALRSEALRAASLLNVNIERAAKRCGDPMVSCYIQSSFEAMLLFVFKYCEVGCVKAMLASVNAGGENVARTSVLGALFGAAYGDNAADKDRWTELRGQLYYHKELTSEINAMLSIKKKE